jgi:N-formylglutamate deformylase
MRPRAFSVTRGEGPLLLSMPHPGTHVPEDIWEQLNERGRALEDTDWHMRALYAFARRFQPTIIESHVSRYVIDLNRDPAGHSLYPGQATTELVPTTTFSGEPIWRTPPDAQEIRLRRMAHFEPYHQALSQEIARIRARHGYCVLYDCHSIKSVIPRLFEGKLPTLNLGTANLNSCAVGIHAAAEGIMRQSGLTYAANGRFKGGWITRRYGKPLQAVHAIQMEIALDAYLEVEEPPWSLSEAKTAALQRTLEAIIAAVLAAAALQRKVHP